MPNLLTHLRFGMVSYPFYLIIYISFLRFFKTNISLSVLDISLSYLFYIVGNDLPDLDSNNAPLRGFTKALSLGFSIYIFTNFIMEKLANLPQLKIPEILLLPISVAISMLIGAGLINLFLSMPIFSHRGFAHSVTFAGIYGLLIYLFSTGKSDNAIFLGISAFAGVMSHMIADYRKNPTKIFKLW